MATNVETITLSIPNNSEYVGVVRLVVSGVASRLKYPLDDVENLKVAVGEACSNAIQYAYGDTQGLIQVSCLISTTELVIEVTDTGKGFDLSKPREEKDFDNPDHDEQGLGLGMTFIKCLVDSAEVVSEIGKGTTVRLSKKRPEAVKA